ncbi:ABC transporter permease [Segeticoccus rhizosphaerae]|jgi:peptide/nickel transport system permease protein|uniref:ABC transporter permease n=1 Tax=Segeticoccus rhizosphaerae TaxID=1104777 RepID=UPI0010C0558E|nr:MULTISPECIES: ABC transporter permease [Intrasporangiaceae]
MQWYILRRVGQSLVTLFIATIVVFVGVRALPGDAATALSAETSNPKVLQAIRQEYGLDQPVPVQYVRWLGHAIQGDLGQSPKTGISVSQTLAERLPVTLELAGLALIIALAIGLPIGILAAVRRGSVADYVASTTALVGLSVPHFWLGILFILGFAVSLQWLPASGFVPLTDPLGNLSHMAMPAVVLGIGLAAVVMRQMRSAMLESLGADFVRTARAKGMSERVVVGIHVLRNSLITVVTVVGLQLGTLISGAVITEQIFIIPGIGKLTIDSVFSRDYPSLQGVVLITATGYIVANLLVDIAYSLLNPRIRVSGGAA